MTLTVTYLEGGDKTITFFRVSIEGMEAVQITSRDIPTNTIHISFFNISFTALHWFTPLSPSLFSNSFHFSYTFLQKSIDMKN